MDKDTGGPAFPVTVEHYVNLGTSGMTMRDYFAAKAMASMVNGTWPDSDDRTEIARRAYLMADAMLVERAK